MAAGSRKSAGASQKSRQKGNASFYTFNILIHTFFRVTLTRSRPLRWRSSTIPAMECLVKHFSVSEAARHLGAKPKDISDLFYRRELRDDLCPIVAGRRLIPHDYLEMIRAALRRNRRTVMRGGAQQ